MTTPQELLELDDDFVQVIYPLMQRQIAYYAQHGSYETILDLAGQPDMPQDLPSGVFRSDEYHNDHFTRGFALYAEKEVAGELWVRSRYFGQEGQSFYWYNVDDSINVSA